MSIKILEQHIADKIAAGEVIERPLSVVKELLENSLDAGASLIEITIKDGGSTLIRVKDNGCGMKEEALEELRRNIDVKDFGRSKSIGLYNINQRLNLHYGGSRNMRIYSEEGKGTTVRLTFFLKDLTAADGHYPAGYGTGRADTEPALPVSESWN